MITIPGAELKKISDKVPILSLIYETGTTMNSILAFVRLLQFGGNGFNDEQKKYFENIASSADHFFEVVEFLTDIIKLQHNILEINPSTTNVQLFLHRLFVNTPAAAYRRRIDFSIDIQPDIGEIDVDQNKMKKIFHDLAENMIMFTEQDRRAGVRAVQDNGEICIQVWNDSAPLAGVLVNQLFLPQIHNSYTAPAGGSMDTVDIGYTLAKKIVELHRGTLAVENGDSKGTSITFTFPNAAAPENSGI